MTETSYILVTLASFKTFITFQQAVAISAKSYLDN